MTTSRRGRVGPSSFARAQSVAVRRSTQRDGFAVRSGEPGRWQGLRRTRARQPPAKHARRLAETRELALACVRQLAGARHHPRTLEASDALARSEEPAVAFDDPVDFIAGIEAGGRHPVLVRGVRPRAEEDTHAIVPGAHAPLGILPIERIVAAALTHVAGERRRAEQRGAAACAKVRQRLRRRGRRRVIQMHARTVGVPIGESRFLAAAGLRVVLEDLRCEREHVGRARRQQLGDRPRVERHVVVHEVRAVVACALQSALDGAGEAQRRIDVYPFHGGKACRNQAIRGAGRAVGDDDHLPRFVDRGQRDVQRCQRPRKHLRCVALRDDDGHARTPRRRRAPDARRHDGRETIRGSHRQIQRHQPQPLPPARSPHDRLSERRAVARDEEHSFAA